MKLPRIDPSSVLHAGHIGVGAGAAVKGRRLSTTDAKTPFETVPFPDHRMFAPRRPPRWVRRAPRRDASEPGRPVREEWRDPRIATALDGGPMRTNFTYRNAFMTSADFSPTIGRDVYAEGPFEGIYRSILSTDMETADFLFQNATISWTTADGQVRRYTFDGGRITAGGAEIWFEMKAHPSYFQLPDVKEVLARAERELALHDIQLDRVDGSLLLEPVRLRSVQDILRHRNVPYDRADVAAAHDTIRAHDGRAPFGKVVEALAAPRLRAKAMMSAMLIRRAIGFPVATPVTDDTPVRMSVRPNRQFTRFID